MTTSKPNTNVVPHALMLLCVVGYLAISFDGLLVTPPVGEDEPWIAAAPYKLASQGVYGSDLFTGYYGSEERSYQVPVLPLLQAVVFRVGGVGVGQMRVVPVVFGAAVLICVFVVGGQLMDQRVAIIALFLLIGLRFGTGHNQTGIPLLDFARIGRPDVLVPAFGMAAWWIVNSASGRSRSIGCFWAGMLTGFATLSHYYGVFWLLLLIALQVVLDGRAVLRRPYVYLMGTGCVVVLLPWLIYVALGWSDFVGQMRIAGERLDVFDPSFYVKNVINEINRLRGFDLMDPEGRPHLVRPGLWATVLGVPTAVVLLLRRRKNSVSSRGSEVVIVLVGQLVLFATLIQAKFVYYVIAFWPLVMLVLAWMFVRLWDAGRRTRWIGVAVFVLVIGEGGARIVHRRVAAADATPYTEFTARVADYIPPGSLVLGLQHYWLGLRQYPYRSWLLPLFQSGADYHHAPVSLLKALIDINPRVILVDKHIRMVLDSAIEPDSEFYEPYNQFWQFLALRGAVRAATISDATYGRMDIYHVPEMLDGSSEQPPARP